MGAKAPCGQPVVQKALEGVSPSYSRRGLNQERPMSARRPTRVSPAGLPTMDSESCGKAASPAPAMPLAAGE